MKTKTTELKFKYRVRCVVCQTELENRRPLSRKTIDKDLELMGWRKATDGWHCPKHVKKCP